MDKREGRGSTNWKLQGWAGALPGELGPTWLSHCSQASHFNEVADLLAPFITVLKEAPGAGAGGAVGCWLLYRK